MVYPQKFLLSEEKRLTWETTSRGEPAIRKQWDSLARAFEAHERVSRLLYLALKPKTVTKVQLSVSHN